VNKGDITITGKNGTAVGILGEGENHIINSGSINVEGKNAYGIRVLDGTNTTIINEGSINVDGKNEAYGIYIDQNASVDTVTNEGTITINKNQNDTSRSIVLNGAELRNKGTMSVTGDLDLNTLGASKVYLEDGATYEANSIKGDLTAGTSTVMNDNLDTYIKTNAIKSKDVDNLSVSSESALFTAKVNKNNEGNSDVVLERKDFSEFTPNKSMADYLTKNYQSKNFEDKFNSLKSEATSLAVQQQLADFMAFDKILNFADENFQVLRSLNRTMADTILKPTQEPYRVIAGYDNFNLETDNKGLLSGYDLNAHSMFTFGDKRLNNWSRLGLGISFTDMSTTYEKGGSRDLNIVSIFMPYLRKFGDKLNLVTILNLGYGYGDYDRGADRKADINDFIYSLTNELRYSINLNNFAELEPALMLNAIGYQEDSLDEKNSTDGIETKKTNNLSVELGAGLFIKKEVKLEKYGKLGFKIGGVYYHEFASPYRDISIHNKNNPYWYKINDYANLYQRDRAVLEAVVDYAYKDLALYVKYNKLIQKNNPDLFDMGIKFNF
ncbi:MAG: autotransporter domain-containing protein, partial [Bacteroidales bacterium]|nr:autotransporter domain-containing protein [Bacteroidales bacterium]